MQTDQVFGGRYQIIGSLGEGGMANVYKARDLILDREVALKIMRLDMRDDPVAQKRFENEIRASTELVHPNITQVYDYGDEDHNQYLVTEYIAGPDLKRYEMDNFPLPLTKVVDIMSQILSGIQLAHEHGIIHRDLKPQNILMTNDGTAKITDFGIARAQSSFGMTQTNMAIGSVHYMAPEQVRGETATPQSDIYSLGIMLYELLAGKVPFDGETAVAVAVKQTTDPMPHVREDDPRIPQALENVILHATAKDPQERYTSANAMRNDLATALSPDRVNEERFVPEGEALNDEATKVRPALKTQPEQQAKDETSAVAATTPDTSKKVEKSAKKDDKPRHKKRYWIIGCLLAIVALCVGITAYGLQQPEQTKVPDIQGATMKQAKAELKSAGLKVGDVTERDSDTIKKDRIISAKPDAGKHLKRGSEVDLVVSTGSRKIRFGDYRNERFESVADSLKAKGYTVTTSHAHSNDVPVGYIMDQSIKPDKKVIPDKTTVNFVISVGPETTSDVSGSTNDGNQQNQNNSNNHATGSGSTKHQSQSQQAASQASESEASSQSSEANGSVDETTDSTAESSASSASNPAPSTSSSATAPSQEQDGAD
ncbi:serine/threonine-protein kinase [Weissella uvarum]|uniref:Stk1 family PASTA domain-containing Ser/Thr kinase n=1 Tax=Weissella uvarum TaxID=1479233 RepID=UPI00195F2544|nr:Stk1 family PASTA domain-containing Ser/Thr kinase [Weissella uvarum]MBM7617765.1 serine/threonine-protein kinase [Weissella uvarum]MCM0595856.1 Stk1 family PASTA domain-containing Ser/Thr kinase [Weissella uvarum]